MDACHEDRRKQGMTHIYLRVINTGSTLLIDNFFMCKIKPQGLSRYN